MRSVSYTHLDVYKRQGNGDALLLTAGQLSRHLIRLRGHTHAIEQPHSPLLGFRLGQAKHLEMCIRDSL